MIKVRKIFLKSSLLNLYYTFAYPYILYCIHAWGKFSKTVLKLNKTQNRLIHIMTPSGYRTNTAVGNFKILKASEIYDYATGVFMYKLYLSIIFIFTIWGCVSSAYPILLWWSRECVLYLIIIIKPEVWIINHCLGLGHETMVCAVCLTMFLWAFAIVRAIVYSNVCLW